MAGTLLFDLDGTLVDSAGDLAGSLDTLMQEKSTCNMYGWPWWALWLV